MKLSITLMQPSLPEPSSQAMLTSWAAGFFDGEACLHIAKIKRSGGNETNYRLRLVIGQNCRRTLTHFQEIMGVQSQLVMAPRRLQYNKDFYELKYDGKQALAVVKKVHPFLMRKLAEAQVALEFYSHGAIGVRPGSIGHSKEIWTFRKQCYEKMRRLK